MPIDTTKTYHLVGIGGAGMSSLAWLLKERGACVTGSDRSESSVTERLRQSGIPVAIGHSVENLAEADVVVVSAAILHENVELEEARRRGLEVVWRADMLGRVMDDYRTRVAVAGTHGKTTTTAMVGLVLMEAGLDPTVLVGGDWEQISGNARVGKSDLFVTEACEAFNSYLHLRPSVAVVTNVEPDHLDFHQDFEGVIRSFEKFLARVDKDGAVIACTDDPTARMLLKQWPLLPARLRGYGLAPRADLRAQDMRFSGLGSFSLLTLDERPLGELVLGVPGEKSILNALAAVAVGLDLGVPFEVIARALAKFTGVDRRFQILGEVGGVTVVDDYAHHPTAIRATLGAARLASPSSRVVSVFQPHLYSRTQFFLQDFADSLTGGDVVIITDVYAAREDPIPGAGAADIARLVNDRSPKKAEYVQNKDEVAGMLVDRLLPGDIVLVLGAGDVWEVGRELVRLLEERSRTEC